MPEEIERIEWSLDTFELLEQCKDYAAGAFGHRPSLRELEKVFGVSAATFSRMDNGKLPDINTLFKLCAAMQVEPQSFIDRQVWVLKK